MELMRNLVQISLERAPDSWGGIIVKPESLKTRPNMDGVVLSIGPDVTSVEVGERVIYGKFAAQELEDSILVHEEDIIAKINGEVRSVQG